MAMRLSGLMSGMDTESIIEQLVMAKRTKLDNTKKAQKKLEWKQDAWKTLNSKIKKLYDGMLSNLRFEGSYMKKTTKVSNSSVVSVITGDNAMNSVQSLKVDKMAQSGYLTGAKLGDGKQGYTSDTTMFQMTEDRYVSGRIVVSVGGEEKVIEVNAATTIGSFVQSLRDAGVEASFDATNQRFYVAAKDTGTANDFSIYAADMASLGVLQTLGLGYSESYAKMYESAEASKSATIEAQARYEAAMMGLRAETIKEDMDDWIQQLKADKYEGLFDGIDLDNWNDTDTLVAIKNKVEELAESGSYDELKGWNDRWDKAHIELSNISKQLEGDDPDTWKLKKDSDAYKSVVDVVEAQINKLKNLAESDSGATKNAATNAEIYLNGVYYEFDRNTFEINGLTLTINSTTAEGEIVTLTTTDDTDGIYDMIKNFLKEYNELINEMDKLYNADSARGYEPLTDEEKEAMSDTEIEEWEKKIKESLLRRDDTLGSVSNALKSLMMGGVSVNGRQMYLSDFGIETLSYFTAAENEKNAYHINGDPDDSSTSGNEDKLRAMIASDPQTVVDFFVGLSRSMYSKMTDLMAHTDYSSSYTIYEDVKMKEEYDSYTSKIKELEKKLADYEDKWYQRFAKMETAMAKMQNSMSAVTSLLGG